MPIFEFNFENSIDFVLSKDNEKYNWNSKRLMKK